MLAPDLGPLIGAWTLPRLLATLEDRTSAPSACLQCRNAAPPEHRPACRDCQSSHLTGVLTFKMEIAQLQRALAEA